MAKMPKWRERQSKAIAAVPRGRQETEADLEELGTEVIKKGSHRDGETAKVSGPL